MQLHITQCDFNSLLLILCCYIVQFYRCQKLIELMTILCYSFWFKQLSFKEIFKRERKLLHICSHNCHFWKSSFLCASFHLGSFAFIPKRFWLIIEVWWWKILSFCLSGKVLVHIHLWRVFLLDIEFFSPSLQVSAKKPGIILIFLSLCLIYLFCLNDFPIFL